MFSHWMFRDPDLALGAPVMLIGTIILPFHLGWTGAPVLSAFGYLATVAILLAVAEKLHGAKRLARWGSALLQPCMIFAALIIPSGLAFAVGSAVGGAEEHFDNQTCASRGLEEADDVLSEIDDTLDVTADCL